MKKILSLAIVFCLLCSLSTVNASAAYMDDPNHVTGDSADNSSTAGLEAGEDAANGDVIGSADIPVYIQTEKDTVITNVYAISYDVSELVFVYSSTDSLVWNPETLEYETTTEGSWNTTSQDITVTNYSDIPVKVAPSNSAPADNGVTVTLGEALELGAAFDGDYEAVGTAKSGTISVGISGTPDGSYEAKSLLSTITLTVTDNRG